MALDLAGQAAQLDELRFCMFLEWLGCHCHQVPVRGVVQDSREIWAYLSQWLETFLPEGLDSEYRLIMTEITWWKDADEKTLLRCTSTELAERNLLR